MPKYDMIAEGGQSTVVAEYAPSERKATEYQSEAALEEAFIAQLEQQAYERINITNSCTYSNRPEPAQKLSRW